MGNVKACLAVHVYSCAVFGLARFITLWGMWRCVLQCVAVIFLLPRFCGWSQEMSCSLDMYSIAYFFKIIAKADEWCQGVLCSLTIGAVILCQVWCQGILCSLSVVILCQGWWVMSDVQMYFAVQMCSCAVFHCQGWWVMSRYFVQSNSKCSHSLQRLMSPEWCQGVSCSPNV